jgi:hypothetical protein
MIYAHKAYEDDGMLLKKLISCNKNHETHVVQLNSVSWLSEGLLVARHFSSVHTAGLWLWTPDNIVQCPSPPEEQILQSVHGRKNYMEGLTDRKVTHVARRTGLWAGGRKTYAWP